jgi:ribonuclease P protein component
MIQMIAGPAPGRLRVGFTATKKLGGAVVRNRCKRRLREAARRMLPLHGVPGHDYVFVARASLEARAWEQLLDDVKIALISLAAPDAAPGSRSGRSTPAARPPPDPSPGPRAPPPRLEDSPDG